MTICAIGSQTSSSNATHGECLRTHRIRSKYTPLLEIPDIAREVGMRLHIHLAEAHMERALRGDSSTWAEIGADSFRALRSHGVGVSSTQFVDHLGVLGPDCHIAHGVYVDAEDRALLRARGTAVALCPRSNTVIGLDMPPVADYLREGNLIAVGTDSLSSSPSLDLLADVSLLYSVAREQGYGNSDLHQLLFKTLQHLVVQRRLGCKLVGTASDSLVWVHWPIFPSLTFRQLRLTMHSLRLLKMVPGGIVAP